MLSKQQYELIDRLILGKPLKESERILYNQSKHDPDFLEELSYRYDTAQALKWKSRSLLKQELRQIDKRDKNRTIRKLIRPAAASILIVGFSVWILYLSRSDSNIYYAQYFRPYENIVDPLTKGNSRPKSGFQEYELGNFKNAKQILRKEESAAAYFYLAMIAMIEEDYHSAEIYLIQAQKYDDPVFEDKIKWYTALMLIHENRTEKAKEILEQLASEENSFYYDKSAVLLHQLRE